MGKKTKQAKVAKGAVGKTPVAAGRFSMAASLHKQALKKKVIRDTQIVSRIVSAFRMVPPIKSATPIAKILGGDANAWDLGLLLMAYPSFRNDGLVLQKGDVMDAATLGDLGDLVFAWYESDGWTILS